MKKSFTLIEILISVAILSVMFLAMSNVIGTLKISKKTVEGIFEHSSKKELLVKTLYADIINADSIKIIHSKDKNFDTILLTTKNSLYGLVEPYVKWYVVKNENVLTRAEGYDKIEGDNVYFIDLFEKNVNKFKIYKKNGRYFVYIGMQQPIYFEIYKGF